MSGSGLPRRVSAELRCDAPSFLRGFSVCAPGGLWPRYCGTTLRCAFVSAGLRYDAPCFCSLWARQAATFLRGSATMRLRFCGTTLRRAFVSARCGRARRPRFCGVALRCAFVSEGLRYDAPAFPRGCVAGARGELGRHYCGVTLLYASAGSLVLRRYLGVYGVRTIEVPVLRRYLGCARAAG